MCVYFYIVLIVLFTVAKKFSYLYFIFLYYNSVARITYIKSYDSAYYFIIEKAWSSIYDD